jgi:AcrR family transcriptional regulator
LEEDPEVLPVGQLKTRTDGYRNRERILKVAKQAFTGSSANASPDDAAKDARVGPETLYHHFPARQEVLKAIHRTELEK